MNEPVREEIETHDHNTLDKVYKGLTKTGLDHQQAVDAITNMQNEGILFRERKFV